jgi:hypothetical protein
MNPIHYNTASICDADEEYIAYIANCAGTAESSIWGAAKSIIEKYPHANVYANRKTKNKRYIHDDWLLNPGKVLVYNNKLSDERGIIVMLAQYTPGRNPFDYKHHGPMIIHETYALRKQWFAECLEIIGSSINPASIAFPAGLHNGNQNSVGEYNTMLVAFAEKYPTIKVSVYNGGAARPHNPPAGLGVGDGGNVVDRGIGDNDAVSGGDNDVGIADNNSTIDSIDSNDESYDE